ncbi:hypothetical protein KSP40_PGU007492 [Platanthera guangdongensis]|uniref:Uncharacterized protein n=1 Tax=Platanthera guangdongensis TaxID=2320717 RepID=A0ABR2LIX4_9ASPA
MVSHTGICANATDGFAEPFLGEPHQSEIIGFSGFQGLGLLISPWKIARIFLKLRLEFASVFDGLQYLCANVELYALFRALGILTQEEICGSRRRNRHGAHATSLPIWRGVRTAVSKNPRLPIDSEPVEFNAFSRKPRARAERDEEESARS